MVLRILDKTELWLAHFGKLFEWNWVSTRERCELQLAKVEGWGYLYLLEIRWLYYSLHMLDMILQHFVTSQFRYFVFLCSNHSCYDMFSYFRIREWEYVFSVLEMCPGLFFSFVKRNLPLTNFLESNMSWLGISNS